MSTGDMNILICELFYMYNVIEDHCMWSYMLYVFPLSYKLSMGVNCPFYLEWEKEKLFK